MIALPLQDLLNVIEAEANEERLRLESDSKAEAEAIVSAAHEEAARARDEVLRARTPATEAEAARRLAVARLEASRLLREARESAFSQLLAEVRRRLAGSSASPAHRDTVRALLQEALAAVPDAHTARVSPRDEPLIAELAREAGVDLTVETDETVSGGVALESGRGRVARNTFEGRLASAEPRLRAWYGGRLEGLFGAGAR